MIALYYSPNKMKKRDFLNPVIFFKHYSGKFIEEYL